MRLTNYTDYALRVLLYAGASDKTVTISEISEAFNISKEHLRKVVHALSQLGYLKTTQGRNGGINLARAPETINIRNVVEHMESGLIVECFNPATKVCAIDGMCGLKHVLQRAQLSFMETLGNYHLSDFLKNQNLIAFSRQ
ncbi:MAG TPA: Rrf2 family transcriptional regulator [Pseudomonadaceae bacterium]|nr:Rrf2 family transcriptional regulator [Pseudomonadaceae bacterium]